MRPIRIGVVGCGGIARGLHLPVISALRDVLELVAVCDKDEARASQAGRKYGVEYFTDLERMLAQDVEAVSVLTHAYTHHTLGRAAAESGKHVLVEKPIAITLPCADWLIKACEKGKVVLEVAENYPFMPMDALINEVSRSGRLGKVVAVYVRDDLNGISLDIGVHRFSQLRQPIQSRPLSVTATVKLPGFERDELAMTDRRFGERFDTHWGRSLVEFEGGAMGVCECFPLMRATSLWAPDYRRVIGSEGIFSDDLWPNIFPTLPEGHAKLHLLDDRRWREVAVEKVEASAGPGESLEEVIAHLKPPIAWESPLKGRRGVHLPPCPEEMAWPGSSWGAWAIAEATIYTRFARAVRDGTFPAYGGEQARLDLELCIAAYESERLGRPIRLPLKGVTPHEKAVHEEFRMRYGHGPL